VLDLGCDNACDIAIVGGGPAGSGCAIALRLRFPKWRVMLLEASDYSLPRMGEVLPALAVHLLRQLRFPLGVLARSGMPAESIASAWGGAELAEEHHLFSARGAGLHLDRNLFDRHLAEHAASLGAAAQLETRLHSVTRKDGCWVLHLSGGKTCSARFLIDATGRSAIVARSLGARIRRLDGLTAYSRILRGSNRAEHRTVVEACALGWWYTAPLPGARRVVSLLTDVDLGRTEGLPDGEAWHRNLRRTQHVSALLDETASQHLTTVSSASTALLSSAVGDGWLATGDAAASGDPLAGQGIARALRSGILASYAAADALSGRATQGLERYDALLRAQFASFQRVHFAHHAREMRWPDQPFWRRRQGHGDEPRYAEQGAAS